MFDHHDPEGAAGELMLQVDLDQIQVDLQRPGQTQQPSPPEAVGNSLVPTEPGSLSSQQLDQQLPLW